MAIPRQIRFTDLIRLLRPTLGLSEQPIPDATITSIVQDSRQVDEGSLFVALTGGSVDGHRFIPEAIRRGAIAVVGTQELHGLPVPYFQVQDGRRALANLAAAFQGFPARQLCVIGVTGTDGKTTTSNLIYSIMQSAGLKAGMISTVSARIGDKELDTGFHVTTPESPQVQGYLAEMVFAGLTHVVLEATSHGLDQQRVAACEFDIGVITNITHEHLDYHGSYSAYREAKAQLLLELARTSVKTGGNPRLAVLNQDDVSFDYLESVIKPLIPPVASVNYGIRPHADLRAGKVEHSPSGLTFNVLGAELALEVQSRLVGVYNVSNCLAAIAATVIGLGVDPEAARVGISAMPGIPGRMEILDAGQDFLAIVDFAHTPNALQRALETARQLVSGRVIAVFGSAGLRDRAKRRLMAETSAELADFTILTAEDPRTENLTDILAEMATGAESRGGVEGKTYWRIPDRGAALRFAVSLAKPGDLVISCGKGHEQSMCFGEIEYPWDDRLALRAALAELTGKSGPQMPYLPTQTEDRR